MFLRYVYHHHSGKFEVKNIQSFCVQQVFLGVGNFSPCVFFLDFAFSMQPMKETYPADIFAVKFSLRLSSGIVSSGFMLTFLCFFYVSPPPTVIPAVVWLSPPGGGGAYVYHHHSGNSDASVERNLCSSHFCSGIFPFVFPVELFLSASCLLFFFT